MTARTFPQADWEGGTLMIGGYLNYLLYTDTFPSAGSLPFSIRKIFSWLICFLTC